MGAGITTAPILLADTLPTGMTLAGTPTLIPGTSDATAASLKGCPTTGATDTTGCTVATGTSVGTFSIKIPIKFASAPPATYPPGNTKGTNTANLSGGGDVTCTAAADACDSTVVVEMANSPTVLMAKTTRFGDTSSSTFNFTMTGLTAASDSITVTGQNTVNSSLGALNAAAGVAVTYTETAVGTGWPSNPGSASCTDANAPGDGNPTGPLPGVTISGKVVTVPAAVMLRAASLTCTLVNTRPQISLTKAIVSTPPDGGSFNLTISAAPRRPCSRRPPSTRPTTWATAAPRA